MTPEEVDQLAYNHAGEPDIHNAIQYIHTLQQRNDNLSQAHRIAENLAEQYRIPLTALRGLNRKFRAGEIDQVQFNAGVNYHATDN